MSVYKKEATLEEMKQEALLRMGLLGLDRQVTLRFYREGALSVSWQAGQQLLLQELDDALLEQVRQFEEKYACLVYHVVWSMNPLVGSCWSLLFVSPTSSDWEDERRDTDRSGLVYAYSHSEMEEGIGEIVVQPREGGLIRVG